MVGLSERAEDVVRRRQPAGTTLPLVLSFGGPLAIDSLSDGVGAGREYRSFVAGLSGGFAHTRFDRRQDCVQVYLTPIGVQRILGVPGSDVARAVLDVGDVARDLGDTLSSMLHAAPTWRGRFELVEQVLLRRAASGSSPPPWVTRMWNEIRCSGGQARIGELVADSGWSHRYVAKAFRQQVGLTPKEVAGLVRFERAAADLGTSPLAEIAARHGYADQSHFTREVKRYAGETPTQLAGARRPTPLVALGGR